MVSDRTVGSNSDRINFKIYIDTDFDVIESQTYLRFFVMTSSIKSWKWLFILQCTNANIALDFVL